MQSRHHGPRFRYGRSAPPSGWDAHRASRGSVSVCSPARAQCRNRAAFLLAPTKGGPIRIAVLVTFSMKTDVATYEAMHAMMTAPGVSPTPGLIVHTAHAINGNIAMVEVWESADDQHRFMSDPRMAADLAAHGVPVPDDLTVTALLIAYQP